MGYYRYGYGYGKGLAYLILLVIGGLYYLYTLIGITGFIIIAILALIIFGVSFSKDDRRDINYESYTLPDLGKTNKTRVLDENGYLRNNYGNLIHRDTAYEYIYRDGYKKGIFTKRFGEYDIHHKDRNKLNNSPDNLQILTREEHKKIHGR